MHRCISILLSLYPMPYHLPMLAPLLHYTPPQRAVYCPDALDAADRARLQRHPHLQPRADWRSSRALKQLLPQPRPTFSLAHRKGHAVLLWGAPCLGVDLEYLQARDFAALLPWFADDAEQRWFMAQADRQLAFYRLWTFKEALLKALAADFASLRSLTAATAAPPGLRWQRYAWLLDGHWLVSAVLAAPQPLPPPRVIGAASVVALPSF